MDEGCDSNPRAPDQALRVTLEEACNDQWGFDRSDLAAHVAHEQMSVLKPHGSVNWQYDLEAKVMVPGSSVADEAIKRIGTGEVSSEISVVNHSPHSDQYRNQNQRVGVPALALPLRGKSHLVWPSQQARHLESLTNRVSRVMTIGWRAAEPDFVDRLKPLMAQGVKWSVIVGGEKPDDASAEVRSNLSSVINTASDQERELVGGFGALHGSHAGRDLLAWFLGEAGHV